MTETKNRDSVLTPPHYCQYTGGRCDQSFTRAPLEAFFIYPSQPVNLARTVAECVRQLQQYSGEERWLSWEGLCVYR